MLRACKDRLRAISKEDVYEEPRKRHANLSITNQARKPSMIPISISLSSLPISRQSSRINHSPSCPHTTNHPLNV